MKKFLFFLFLLIVAAAAYLTGSRGTDPTQWFAPPTPTPTCTATSTSTPEFTLTATPTATLTSTPTATFTATPVPKKKAPKKKPAPKPTPTFTPIPPPEPPALKPICNAPSLPSAVAEVEPNNTFATAQDLGALTAAGLQVKGTLEKVARAADTATADATKVDPKVETTDMDVDVYAFTASTPFLAVLDCYSHVVGRPSPLYHEENYHLEIYNDAFEMIGSSNQNNPVESIEMTGTGSKYYVVVYGVDGTDGGNYRLTLTRKEAE